MGKKSKKGRATVKPKHSAAGQGGSSRKSATASVTSDMLSQATGSIDGFRSQYKQPPASLLSQKQQKNGNQRKAPPMNITVTSPMPESTAPEASTTTTTTTQEVTTVLDSKFNAKDGTPESSTAGSTPESSPLKSESETVLIEPTPVKADPTTTTTTTTAAPTNTTTKDLAVVTAEGSLEPSSSMPTSQPITPDEVLRSTSASLRDHFTTDPTVPAVLDVSVDDDHHIFSDDHDDNDKYDVSLNALDKKELLAMDTTSATSSNSNAPHLNLSTPSPTEAHAPQSNDCCIVQ
jgi:hypothetical protein